MCVPGFLSRQEVLQAVLPFLDPGRNQERLEAIFLAQVPTHGQDKDAIVVYKAGQMQIVAGSL
ncbi:hypothetical protein ccbrp13_05140 [Ktedonobacteria bacterium brp13]|nr:hypothetical protein ccbrp13_05140 [Ktedonobacteria bacterium brp13]